jgi:hypothetical protein
MTFMVGLCRVLQDDEIIRIEALRPMPSAKREDQQQE